MRFLPALALAALVAAPAVSAQTTFGLKAGVQAANVNGTFVDLLIDEDDDGVEKQARLGFVGGLTADLPLSANIVLRPEVLYAQKGFAIAFDDAVGLDGTITSKVDYLEVPLLLAYQATTLSGLSYSVEAGPTLAYKLSSSVDCDVDGAFGTLICNEIDVDDNADDDDDIEDFDIGGAIGATVGSGPFGVGVRYTQGFTNAYSGGDGDESARSSVFSATLHYKFGAR